MANPYLVSMYDTFQQLRVDTINDESLENRPPYPPNRGVSLCRCGICHLMSPKALEIRLQWVFILMTRNEDVVPFLNMLISTELLNLACLVTSDSLYFLTIASSNNGSKHLQKFLGKSEEVNNLLCAAILRIFLQIMTDKYASSVAIIGMRVLTRDKKKFMYEQVLKYALHLARHQYGCIVLNKIITDVDSPYYRNQLLDMVADNALWLSNDAYGNLVVQHVLKLHDLRTTHNIGLNLRGQFVELSFKKHGSYIVELLLRSEESIMEAVVAELSECEEERLLRLARSEYGNSVVLNAIKLTREISTPDVFCGLVNKLMPFRNLLHRSPGSNIKAILDSFHSMSSN